MSVPGPSSGCLPSHVGPLQSDPSRDRSLPGPHSILQDALPIPKPLMYPVCTDPKDSDMDISRAITLLPQHPLASRADRLSVRDTRVRAGLVASRHPLPSILHQAPGKSQPPNPFGAIAVKIKPSLGVVPTSAVAALPSPPAVPLPAAKPGSWPQPRLLTIPRFSRLSGALCLTCFP